jgi:hypothetical protein
MSAKKNAETTKPSGSDAPACSTLTDRETYRQECRKRWDGEALRDAVQNWRHWKSINQELREAMRQFRRNPTMTDLNGTDHANGTLTDYLWKLQTAMQPDRGRLDPLIDFCEHYQKCHLRRGLIIYCTMLLQSFESNAGAQATKPNL